MPNQYCAPFLKWASYFLLVLIGVSYYTSKRFTSADVTIKEHAKAKEKGFFKICNINGDGKSFEVDADKCPNGAWLSESVKDHRICVCLRGAWAISHGWCDEDYHIAYGKGHCFELNKKIQKLSYLGNPEDAFEPANFITTDKGNIFQNFSKEFKLNEELSKDRNKTIVRLRPEKGSHVLFQIRSVNDPKGISHVKSVCLESDPSTGDGSDDALLIYKVKGGVESVEITEYCPSSAVTKRLSGLKIVPGEVVHIKHGHISKHSVRCRFQCTKKSSSKHEAHKSALVRRKRQVLSDYSESVEKGKAVGGGLTSTTQPTTTEMMSTRVKRATKSTSTTSTTAKVGTANVSTTVKGKPKGVSTTTKAGTKGTTVSTVSTTQRSQTFQPLKLDREFSENERDDSVNIANLRVARQELNWLLEGVRPPTLNNSNWKLMKKLKEVFTTACPKTEAPKFMVNAMMRLFRLFYLNSRDFYPNGHMPEDKEQMNRLEKSLDNCLKDATAIEFRYGAVKDPKYPQCRTVEEEVEEEEEVEGAGAAGNGTNTNSTNTNATTATSSGSGLVNVTYCRCVNQLTVLNFSYSQNISGEAAIIQLHEKDSNLTLSPDLTFKLKKESELFGEYHDFPTETVWKMITFGHYYCSKYFRDMPGDHSALMTRLEDLFNEEIIYRWTRPGYHSNKLWQFLYSTFNLKQFAQAMDACVSAAKSVSEYPTWINRPTLELRRKRRSLTDEKRWKGTAYCLPNPSSDPVKKRGVAAYEAKCSN